MPTVACAKKWKKVWESIGLPQFCFWRSPVLFKQCSLYLAVFLSWRHSEFRHWAGNASHIDKVCLRLVALVNHKDKFQSPSSGCIGFFAWALLLLSSSYISGICFLKAYQKTRCSSKLLKLHQKKNEDTLMSAACRHFSAGVHIH